MIINKKDLERQQMQVVGKTEHRRKTFNVKLQILRCMMIKHLANFLHYNLESTIIQFK